MAGIFGTFLRLRKGQRMVVFDFFFGWCATFPGVQLATLSPAIMARGMV